MDKLPGSTAPKSPPIPQTAAPRPPSPPLLFSASVAPPALSHFSLLSFVFERGGDHDEPVFLEFGPRKVKTSVHFTV